MTGKSFEVESLLKSIDWIFNEIEKSPSLLGDILFLRWLILLLLDLRAPIESPYVYRFLQTIEKIDDTADIHNAPQKCIIYSRLKKEAGYLARVAERIDFERGRPDNLFISLMCTVFAEFPEAFEPDTLNRAREWLEGIIEKNIKERNPDALSFNLLNYYKLSGRSKKLDRWIRSLLDMQERDHWPPVNPVWGDEISVTANCIYNLLQLGIDPSSEPVRRAVSWLKRQMKLNGSWRENPRITTITVRSLIAASRYKKEIQERFLDVIKEYEAKELMNQLLAIIRTSSIEEPLKLRLVAEGQIALLQRGSSFKEKVKSFATKISANPDIAKLAPMVMELTAKLLTYAL